MDQRHLFIASTRLEAQIGLENSTASEDVERDILVKLTVGTFPEQRTFTISKSLLLAAGGFFAACFRHGMQETATNEVTFPEESIVPFERLIGYMRKRPGPNSFAFYDDAAILECMECYKLAEKYCLHKIQDAIVDGLSGYWLLKMPHHHFAWILHNIDPLSSLYKLGTYRIALNIARRPLEYLAEDHADNGGYPYSTKEYIDQIEKLFGVPKVGSILFHIALQSCDWPPFLVDCRFHLHAAGEECESLRRLEAGYAAED